jgi:hypothetical protein
LSQLFLHMAGNAYVYDGLGFRSASLSHVPNEIKKTKLQIYASPQAGINILLAVIGLLLTLFKAVSFVTRYVTPIFINQSSGGAFLH